MNKAELDHVWDRIRSVFEDEFRQRGWLPEIDRLRAEKERLLAVIDRYADHDEGCEVDKWHGGKGIPYCSCGFNEAKGKIEP